MDKQQGQRKFSVIPIVLPPIIMIAAMIAICMIIGSSYRKDHPISSQTNTSSVSANKTTGKSNSTNKSKSNSNTNSSSTDTSNVDVTSDKLQEDINKAFKNAIGKYSDGNGNTVNIQNSDKIIRTLTGGGDKHVYDEKITGFQVMDNGYLINVQCEDSKYSYKCVKEDDKTKLYVDFDDEWNANYNDFHFNEAQIYTKE